MSFIRRFGIKRALVVAAITGGLGALAAAALPVPPPWPPPPPPPTSDCGYCYNVDIPNTTSTGANDLHVTLQGPSKICNHYTGGLNPFGLPATQINGNKITVDFASATTWVQPGEIAHIGFCVNSPVSGMVQGDYNSLPPFYWTRRRIITGDIIAVGHAWQVVRADLGTLSPVVTLINTTPTNIHIRQIDWAVVNDAIPLNDLMWNGLEQALEWQPLPGGQLEPASSEAPSFFQAPIPAEFEPTDSRHIVFRVWAEDAADPRKFNRGLGQASIATLAQQDQ
ncbi:MAG: hypothetical protein JXB05_27770 [Myxococcaceae bacterium]|nr:hypothetical protein [Myxococcaceae bacterium]